MLLLKKYRKWQLEERFRLGAFYENRDFVFSKDDGNAMHPDSVTNYFTKFSKKYNLPHINSHAFRHTMASMLYYNGVDTISISNRLGHAQASTTADIYAHVIEKADEINAKILANVF